MFELKLLEYPKILEKIASFGTYKVTKEDILSMVPSSDKDEVILRLSLTEEARVSVIKFGRIDLPYFEIEDTIERIRLSAPLLISEFLELLKLIGAIGSIQTFFRKVEAALVDTHLLKEIYGDEKSLSIIKDAINNTIDSNGEILDSASDDLYKIRKKIKDIEARLSSKTESLLKVYSSKLSESLVTMRNGRRVLPVRAEYKAQIPGIVEGESASGSTIFIEPYALVEIENDLEHAKEEEKREIDRILYALSVKMNDSYLDIKTDYTIIMRIDEIFSMAYYAIDIDATMPLIGEDIKLLNARHPMIDPKVVVSNTITLKKNETMIITGPNTGGKTVVLKTLGLLSLMAQSGILIPAKEGSSLPVFSGIYADIGDEQSIEQSLSTFSSHMTRIVSIISKFESDSLILLDELGSGTDPKEGASLAIAIVETLRKYPLFLLATTHYPELKAYAYSKEGVINASVEFDVNTLKPTYRLLEGIPGSSNAFLISSRLGLSPDIIKLAENVSGDFSSETSTLIKKLETESQEVNKKMVEYTKLNDELKKTLEDNKTSVSKERTELRKELEKVHTERNVILERTQREADHLLKEIAALKEALDRKEEVKENVIIEAKSKVQGLYQDKLDNVPRDNHEIKVGDQVRILEFGKIGTVDAINKGKYEVSMGQITSSFNLKEIEYVQPKKEPKNIFKKEQMVIKETSLTLDLRGMRFEDAEMALDTFIDQSVLNNVDSVDIIHGYGTLALRKMVINFAKTHDVIKRYRSGGEGEGGNGVTVLYLK